MSSLCKVEISNDCYNVLVYEVHGRITPTSIKSDTYDEKEG